MFPKSVNIKVYGIEHFPFFLNSKQHPSVPPPLTLENSSNSNNFQIEPTHPVQNPNRGKGMSGSSEEPHSQLSSNFFVELLDSIIIDVASECHRIARLGLDVNLEQEEEELRLSLEGRASDPSTSGEASSKNIVDMFGQTHPAIADEILDCMHCGRLIVAGRFAPHLEKCMGKGRTARQKVTRSSTMAQNRHSRGSSVSVYAPYSNPTSTNRHSNGTSSSAGEDYSSYAFEGP